MTYTTAEALDVIEAIRMTFSKSPQGNIMTADETLFVLNDWLEKICNEAASGALELPTEHLKEAQELLERLRDELELRDRSHAKLT